MHCTMMIAFAIFIGIIRFSVVTADSTCQRHVGPSFLQQRKTLHVAEPSPSRTEEPDEEADAPSIFVAVLSRRYSFKRRVLVRKGWAKAWSGVIPRFVICDLPHENELRYVSVDLKKESDDHGDLLFVSCMDSYADLTSKVVQALQVYQRGYRNQSVFFKTDDDTFVSWKKLQTYLAHRWLPAIGHSMYAGEKIRDSISGRSPIRDPCCEWYQNYEDYPNETWPRSFQGGIGYLLGRDVVHAILKIHSAGNGRPLLQPEDRQIAVWVHKASQQGDKVVYLRIPGFAGFTPRDFWRHCSILNFTEVQMVRQLENDAHTGHWKSKPHILLHNIPEKTMSCLNDLDADKRPTDLLDDCFTSADRLLDGSSSNGHNAMDGYFQASGMRDAQEYQGCECNLCGDGLQQWLIILGSGRGTGSSTILSMLNSIPGFYIAGEHHGIIDDLLSIHQKMLSQGLAKDGAMDYHALVSEHKLLCAMQSSIRAAMGGSLEQFAVVGFKEIRYTEENQLNFILRLFPCARFIISSRRDTQGRELSESHNMDFRDLSTRKGELQAWAREDRLRDLAFEMQLEDFRLDRFNSLLRWIGVSNCTYSRVAHERHQHLLPTPMAKVPMNGTCVLDNAYSRASGK